MIASSRCFRMVQTGIITYVCCALSMLVAGPAYGQTLRHLLDDVVRGTARVADEIPIKKVDDLVAELSRSRAAHEAVDAELRKAGQAVVRGGASRSEGVIKLLRAAASELNPSVLRRIEGLDEATREAAYIMAKGGDELAVAVPDLATRARLLHDGGAEMAAVTGMFGRDAARAALRLDEAIRGGSIVIKDGARAVSVADFASIMTRSGDSSWKFWKQYVKPHWEIWATSGALAAYLTNPEYFQDAAGRLTEAGFKHLTEFAGELAAATVRGTGNGSATAVEKVIRALRDIYLTSDKAIFAAVGTIIFGTCISLLFPRVRYWAFRPIRWLCQTPDSSKSHKL